MNLFRVSPLAADLRQYQPDWLVWDLLAGLSVAAVQVPTAVAYAELAGFSPEVGLYASILPVIVYAIFASSRQLVVGPDAATCTMVASLVAPIAGANQAGYHVLAAALSIAAGIIMLLGGAARMGFIVNFFARPILIGFLNGVAATIIVGQIGKLFGIALRQDDFVPTLLELIARIGETNSWTLAAGCGTLLCLALLRRFAPKAPAALIALVLVSVVLIVAGGTAHGVKLIGSLPAGLPHLSFPSVGYHAGQGLFVAALGLVIVSFTSGMLTARSFAARANMTLNANREMWALGAANLVSGLSGAFAVTGADSRTAVNVDSNSKTQLASIFAALATAAVAAFFTGAIGYVPQAALAAVLVFSAVQLFDLSSYAVLRHIDILEFRLCVLTTVGVIACGVLPGVAIAITLALTIVLVRIYKPNDAVLGHVPGLDDFNDIKLSAQSTTLPEAVLWCFEGPVVFFNADYFKSRALEVAQSQPTARWFVLNMESISQMDSTGLQALQEFQRVLNARAIKLLLVRPQLYMLRFRQLPDVSESFIREAVFPTLRAAVDHIHGAQD